MTLKYERFTEDDLRRFAAMGVRVRFNIPQNLVRSDDGRTTLVAWGGQGFSPDVFAPPNYYTLVLDGDAVQIEAREAVEGEPGKKVHNIKVEVIRCPARLNQADVEDAFRAASEVFWQNLEGFPPRTFVVQFPSKWEAL